MEVANLVAAPYAGLLLADLGADVIKVEPPGGDLSRGFGPYLGEQSVFFVAMNRGKRSVCLDPKQPRSRAALARLAASADVVLHNLRAGAMERMGLGEDDVRQDNPDVIYAVVTAFGSDGPYADRAGIDVVFQGESGMISITGHPGDPPQKTATTIGDYVAAAHIATAIVAALKDGVGRRVEVAVRDSLIAVQSGWNALHFADGAQPPRTGTASPYLAPNQVLATADGHLTLAVTSDRHFAVLCEVIERPDLATAYPGNEETDGSKDAACRRVGSGLPYPPDRRMGRPAGRCRPARREGAHPARCLRRPTGAPQRDGGGDHRPGRRADPNHRHAAPGRFRPGTGGPPSAQAGRAHR